MTAHLPLTATVAAQPRAIGSVRVSSKAVKGRSVVRDLYQQGAAKVVFPRAARGMTAVLLNTSGGVTGGDAFDYSVSAGEGTHLTITTQACERAYRAQPDEVGRIKTRLVVKDNATLWWLPQETLVFDGCNIQRQLACDLAATAQMLIVEPICFGRVAMGETVVHGTFRDRVTVTRNDVPLVLDAWQLEGDMTATMYHAAVGAGATAMVSVTYVAPDAEAHLPRLRDLLPKTGGASLLADDTLVLRLLAPTGYHLRKALLPILDHLTDGHLPICWRL